MTSPLAGQWIGQRLAYTEAVTTIDVWKSLALVVILVDHVGHFLLPEADWLRVFGRSSLPVWFFLIGFAGGRGVPPVWLGLGIVLTLLDLWWVGSVAGAQLSILFSFAVIRLALPWIERVIWLHPGRLALLALALAALAALANQVIEYGTEGPLLALVGVAHRRWIEQPGRAEFVRRIALALAAGALFVWIESVDYGFDVRQTMVLALLIAIVSLALFGFRRDVLTKQPPAAMAAALRFCGRYSLWLYAGQIVLLAALAATLGIDGANDDEDET